MWIARRSLTAMQSGSSKCSFLNPCNPRLIRQSASADGFLHLIHQPRGFAIVADVASGDVLPAIAADQLDVVIRRPLAAARLHADGELEVGDLGAGHPANPFVAEQF